MKLTEIKLPNSFDCPACGGKITNAAPTWSAQDPRFRKGTVIICSKCTTVLQCGDNNLQLMSADQINALSQESKAAIILTRTTLQKILEKDQNKSQN